MPKIRPHARLWRAPRNTYHVRRCMLPFVTCNIQHAARNMQHAAYNTQRTQHTACNIPKLTRMECAARKMQPEIRQQRTVCNVQHGACNGLTHIMQDTSKIPYCMQCTACNVHAEPQRVAVTLEQRQSQARHLQPVTAPPDSSTVARRPIDCINTRAQLTAAALTAPVTRNLRLRATSAVPVLETRSRRV